jgi:L,D-peptidoglycan transpeptidase YkuD (ErfK/YbiS/YcfS/YnhG family)
MDLLVSSDGWAIWNGRRFRCALGPAGVRQDKREGDGATPAGRFPFRRVLYRADRLARPKTALPCAAIARQDGWCDDPAIPAYNRPVTLPVAASHERLWREDGIYDVIVVIGHNDDPVLPGRGSAVFLHVAHDDFRPTAGCVALARDDLLQLLSAAKPGDGVSIGA